MTITSGTKLGSYEIAAALGAGGMGEVYRARDSKLDRPVAIKVLGVEYSSDTERLRRFEQEARSASALNHPNIVTIYDVGRQNGTAYLAMEFVDGKTVRELLDAGPLPLKKALGIAAQVADGLAKAHVAGIVHRDLKPENVMVTADGLVKILDFGLAKLVAVIPEAGATATAAIPATSPGVVLGTVGYMSPEQARGAQVDFRSDQFSLGTLLYEMLTGKRPFQRESSAQTMAAIIEDEPAPVSELNPKIPAPVRWIVERCLAKEPEERYASTRDLARDLQRVRDHLSEASSGSVLGLQAAPGAVERRYPPILLIGVAVAALIAGVITGAALFRTKPPEPPTVGNLTFSGDDAAPSASHDGRFVVFDSGRDGTRRIWLKQLGSGGEVPITQGPDFEPRVSPDDSMIVYTHFEGEKAWVCRSAVVGGEARKLAEGASADWSPDGKQIVFTRGNAIWVMSPDGTGLREVHTMTTANTLVRALRWSPDGHWIAIESQAGGITSENVTFALLSPDGKQFVDVKPAFPGGDISSVSWIGSDEVLYARNQSVGSIGAVNTSASRLVRQKVPTGPARILLWFPGGSSTVEPIGPGRLVLDNFTSRENIREVELDKKPHETGSERWLSHGSSVDRQPYFSPDGQWVVFTSNRSGNLDIWELSTKDGTVRRLTDNPADDWDPGFTPDGKLLWTSHRSGNFEIWMAEGDGSGAHQVSHDGVDAENPTSTPDGWILYNSGNPAHRGVWRTRADGSQARLLVPGIANWPDASPDGRYVLVTSNEAIGVYQVSDGKEVMKIGVPPVALEPGMGRARWMPDGRAIAFITKEAGGKSGIFVQPFVPGQDTTSQRRLLVSDPERHPETFAISRDGKKVVYAVIDTQSNLLIVDGVAGIKK